MTDPYPQARAARATEVQVDQGLRSYMLRVYNYMTSGLAITGLVSYVVAQSGLAQVIWGTPIAWVLLFSPMILMLFMGRGIQRVKPGTAQALFWGFSAFMGLWLSYIFLAYTATSIVRVFFIAAAMFGAMSLYGYTTKRSLAGWRSFLMMGMIGVLIGVLINIFLLQSTMLDFVVSGVAVILFAGLTAYDTQRIKQAYVESDGEAALCKKAILGALLLYFNFIGLFVWLLHLFGGRN